MVRLRKCCMLCRSLTLKGKFETNESVLVKFKKKKKKVLFYHVGGDQTGSRSSFDRHLHPMFRITVPPTCEELLYPSSGTESSQG